MLQFCLPYLNPQTLIPNPTTITPWIKSLSFEMFGFNILGMNWLIYYYLNLIINYPVVSYQAGSPPRPVKKSPGRPPKSPSRARSKSRTRAVSKSPARRPKSSSPQKKRAASRSRSRSRSRATQPITAVQKSQVVSMLCRQRLAQCYGVHNRRAWRFVPDKIGLWSFGWCFGFGVFEFWVWDNFGKNSHGFVQLHLSIKIS
mgnify:CR=1 FL=1